jgi:hypothetical protein
LVIAAVLSSQAYYLNNRLFTGLFLLLVGLYDPRAGVSVLRYQLAVLYFGAGLNKLLDVDWRSGAFIADWVPHYVSSYRHIASALPDTVLSAAVGWLGIVTELLLVPLLLVRRLVALAIFVGVAYHSGLALLTGITFGMFWYALVASYVALLEWPSSPVVVSYSPARSPHRRLRQLLERIDFDRGFEWRPREEGALEVRVGETTYAGSTAVARALVHSPALYFALFLLVAVPPHGRVAVAPVLVLLAVLAHGFVSGTGALARLSADARSSAARPGG